MKVYIQIVNHLGTFDGEVLNLHEEQYAGLLELSKNFYKEAELGVGFETRLQDGSFMVVSPEVMKNSVMILRKIKDE